MTQPLPGWYPDPSDPSRQRYFDGKTWTENYAPFTAPPRFPAQPAKQPSNGKLFGLLGGGLVALILFAACVGGNSNDHKSSSSSSRSSSSSGSYAAPATTARPTATTPSGPSVAPAGSSVRDGKFEFQVLGVTRSASKEGVFNPEQAKGEFFVITLRVTNIGDEPRTFWASNQKLIINGNTYEATSSLSDDSWRQDINPGLSITAKVEFDIPPGAVPQAIVCHDSAFSGGAHLAL